MTKRMLVDATHAEEVRVAIVQDQRLIDLDIETASREQIKGNIYLARVTRVEPALQAAFVEFHGGRQGFLSVNDIHHKYYPNEEPERENRTSPSEITQPVDPPTEPASSASLPAASTGETRTLIPDDDDADGDELPPTEELRFRPRRRHLPIQRLLTRGQTILVQIAKEARGNKGASLTTNISLAGRYTVLLPENSGGGGISRKITDPLERKHLKEILSTMDVPNHVSLIIRTAGLGRTKREIARDMSYLLRLWKMITDKAKASKAPAIIHEEGDLIIRTIRDLYTTDMEQILIEGQDGYRIGKDFMRLLMPRYVKVVQPYKDSLPIFARHQIENQIESMHERKVPLRSGGYLVIDPTEALVSIDINSGRSTREKDVEMTAFKTNCQAAEEIGRQLRLRDLGGLIVIDFIDMEDKKHILEVEKQLKDAFKVDRAKVQIGRISTFGLMELSRQRMKPTFSETNRLECPRCKGLGTIRSVESASIHLFHQLEEDASKERYNRLFYTTSQEVANYLLNNKRDQIRALELNHELVIFIYGDPSLQTPEFHKNRVEWSPEELLERAANHPIKPEVSEETDPSDDLDPDELDDLDDPEDQDDLDDKRDLTIKETPAPKARVERKSRQPPVQGRQRGVVPAKAANRKEPAIDTGTETSPDSSSTTDQPEQPLPHVDGTSEAGERTRRRRRRRRKPALTTTTPSENTTSSNETPSEADASPQEAAKNPEIEVPTVTKTVAKKDVMDGAVATHVPGLYTLASPLKPEEPSVAGLLERPSPEEATALVRPQRRRRRRKPTAQELSSTESASSAVESVTEDL